jgi:5-methylcytosine-specific restriction endonuclease McrA
MKVSEVSRLSNDALRCGLKDLVAQDRTTTVKLLIHLGEFDSRRLYRDDGYSCMKDYCQNELAMSEDVAYKRIWVARKARRFPSILISLSEGSLTLSAVAMLSRYLSAETADELLAAATRKTNAQVAELIAQRFPAPDLPTLLQPIASESSLAPQLAFGAETCQGLAARQVESPVESSISRSRVAPLAPQRHAVQFTIGQGDLELLRRAQDLLSHQVPSRDAGEIFVRALRVFVSSLEKRKFGATDKPRRCIERPSRNSRHVPAHVRRAVRARDGDRCTFVGENGKRCDARGFLEFDHVRPIARGGRSTPDNLRLRCRAHNQFEAEKLYGHELMRAKREGAQREGAKRRAEEVIPWLRALGIRAAHAREAAERCDLPGASLEQRVKAALSCFAPRDVALRRATPVP